jgi:phosphoglycolate phosphatase-like HAD superfamily hydrolase
MTEASNGLLLAPGLRAVIFDFDDTLMDTRRTRTSLLIDCFARFGHSIGETDVVRQWGKPFPELVESLAPGIDYQGFRLTYSQAMLGHPPSPLPGATELLSRLADRGTRVEVVSSGSRELVLQDLIAGGLIELVTAVWACEDGPYSKPDPRVLDGSLTRLQRLGITNASVALIGDSVYDYTIATAHDLLFLAVLTGRDTRDDFLSAGLEGNCAYDSLRCLIG